MSRRIFSFDQPDRFVAGAVGQPGQRTFFLQAAKGAHVVSVALEKAQVAILAERLATLLLALRQRGVDIGERQRWNVRNNIVGSHPVMFVQGHDVEHADKVASDTGPSAAYARRLGNQVQVGVTMTQVQGEPTESRRAKADFEASEGDPQSASGKEALTDFTGGVLTSVPIEGPRRPDHHRRMRLSSRMSGLAVRTSSRVASVGMLSRLMRATAAEAPSKTTFSIS